MALVKAGVGPLRMDQLTFDLSGEATGNSSFIRITYAAGEYTQFDGAFQYNQFGQPSGTITGITDVLRDRTLYTLTRGNIDVQVLFSQPDILAAQAYVLRLNDQVYGGNRNDTLLGFGGNDELYGKGGADILAGMTGRDSLYGDIGRDTLIGGTGADRLYGGADGDTFVYTSIADSTPGAAGRDRIYDFSGEAGDKIDLSAIDANNHTTINDAFTVVDSFHRVAGELTITAASGGFLIYGDTDGNGRADFGLFVLSDAPLTANDFTL